MESEALLGQHDLRRMFECELRDNKVSHATLLTGPPGIGKKTWGRYLARAILCTAHEAERPCFTCLSCRRFESGNHPEFNLISPEKQKIKIEQMRAIRQSFYLLGDNKVCLIEHAETMTGEACSSLLKILEEPPEGLHFILLADQPGHVFGTIISRCRHYTLQPLDQAEIINLLHSRVDVADEAKIELIASLSHGIPGYALEMASGDRFTARLEEARTLAFNIRSACDSAHQLLLWAESLALREDLPAFLELFCLVFRDALLARLPGGAALTLDQARSAPWLETVSPAVLEETILLINETVNEMIETNANQRLLMEKMLILIQRGLVKCPV